MVPTQIAYSRDKICQRLTYVQHAGSKGTNGQSYNGSPTKYGITECQNLHKNTKILN